MKANVEAAQQGEPGRAGADRSRDHVGLRARSAHLAGGGAFQVPRVARERGIAEADVRRLVDGAHRRAAARVPRRAGRQRAGAEPGARRAVSDEEIARAWPTDAVRRRVAARARQGRRARAASRVHRRRAGRRQDLPDARGRPRAEAPGARRRHRVRRDRTAAPTPWRRSAISSRCRCGEIEYRGVTLQRDGRRRRSWRAGRRSPSSTSWRTPTRPGSTHQKRYEDVLELLDAGINVITAVNIQHIESLNDAIASTTGVRVRETVPDWVLKRADEVVNVDVSVETLRDAAAAGQDLRRREDRAGAHQLLPQGQPDRAARAGAAAAGVRSGRQGAGLPRRAKGSSGRSFPRR